MGVLISCGPSSPTGCDGGDVSPSLKFIHEFGLPDDTCHNYEAKSSQCDAKAVCQDCMTGYDPVCWARRHFPLYRIKEYGSILPQGNISGLNMKRRQGVIDEMVLRMKAEIWKRGPIICAMACPDPIGGTTDPWHSRGYVDDYTPFILHNTDYSCLYGNWSNCTDHDVVVSGWGIESGKPYWIVRNSWGTWWGEGGWFRIVMGINNLGIESECHFGVPDLEGMFTDKRGFPHFATATPERFADRFHKENQSQMKTNYSDAKAHHPEPQERIVFM